MATAVSTAIGTQRQFAKQPERVYQANLKNPSFGRGISVGSDEGAKLLARSLGVLGDAMVRESIASDNRKKEKGIAEANRRFEVTSEEDKHKLAALDILGRGSDFDMSDNPYAVARVEELRGQYLSKQYKNRYETEVLPNQELAPNSQANAKQFEDFMMACLEEDNVKITDNVAFSEGFYGNRPNDLLEMDAKYRQRKQADLIADRNAGIASKLDGILSASINTPPDELAGLMQDLQVDGAITNLSLSERVKLFSEAGKQIAGNGNSEQLKAWGETVAWFDNDGNEKRIKDILPMGDLLDMAAKANVALNEAASRAFFKGAEGLPSAALAEYFDNLKATDPSLYKAVAGKYDDLYAKKQKEEAEAIKDAAVAQEVIFQNNAANDTLDGMLAAFTKGEEFFTTGSGSVFSSGDNYLVGGKSKKFSDQQIISWVTNKLAENSKLAPDEQHKANVEVLSLPAVKPYRDNLKAQFAHNLATPTVSSVNNVLNLYKNSPQDFETLFGNELADRVNMLNLLTNAHGIDQGVVKFAEAQNTLNDKDARSVINKTVKEVSDATLNIPEVPMLGSNDTDSLSIDATNIGVKVEYERLIRNYTCLNYDADTATTLAQKDLANRYVSYEGVAIPNGFFHGIQSGQQQKVAYAFLNSKGNPDNIVAHYIGDRITLSEKNKVIYTADRYRFCQDANKWLAGLSKEHRVTVEDIYGNLDDSATDELGGIYD